MVNRLLYKKNKENVQTRDCFVSYRLLTTRVGHQFQWAIFRFFCSVQMQAYILAQTLYRGDALNDVSHKTQILQVHYLKNARQTSTNLDKRCDFYDMIFICSVNNSNITKH